MNSGDSANRLVITEIRYFNLLLNVDTWGVNVHDPPHSMRIEFLLENTDPNTLSCSSDESDSMVQLPDKCHALYINTYNFSYKII